MFAGKGTQGLMHTKQALPLNYLSSLQLVFWNDTSDILGEGRLYKQKIGGPKMVGEPIVFRAVHSLYLVVLILLTILSVLYSDTKFWFKHES
jgi:hypothetical protein